MSGEPNKIQPPRTMEKIFTIVNKAGQIVGAVIPNFGTSPGKFVALHSIPISADTIADASEIITEFGPFLDRAAEYYAHIAASTVTEDIIVVTPEQLRAMSVDEFASLIGMPFPTSAKEKESNG